MSRTTADEADDDHASAAPRTRSPRGPSMGDVAAAAGVSGQTVSRVANGRANVDEKTRDRVLEAMRQVGYRPNSAARALRIGRFHSIGVIMFELSTVGNANTLDAIVSAATRAGYAITLMPVREQTQGEVSGAFHRLSEQAVDGVIILIEGHQLNNADIELPAGLPVVVIDSNARYSYPIVDTNQAEGAELATEHLLSLGHETVWHIAGPPSSYAAERREKSWRATLGRHHRPAPPVLVGDWSADCGYRLGTELAANDNLTAIFAANDQMALGLLRALHEAGRAVPQDVSVVGFDDIGEAANFWPPLTTVRQSFSEVGRVAVDNLIGEIQTGGRQAGLITVPTTLIVRQSTARHTRGQP